MNGKTLPQDRYFSADGFDFDLEEIAESITSKEIPDGAKRVISSYMNEPPRELSHREAQIEGIFNGPAYDEGSMKLRLALTRYFLQTGRELLPEMRDLLISGITDFIKDGKPWPRPNLKRTTDPEHLIVVLALSNKFRGTRADIAAELGISASGVDYLIKQAKKANYPELLRLFENNMPSKFFDALELLKPEIRDAFIRKYGVIAK